ncbi:MAG: PilZ domain-containing protein [Gaiellales bacterium]
MVRKPSREELLALALGVLPELPCGLEVLSEDGGSFVLDLFQLEDELIHAYGPRDQVRKELHLLARITDEVRGRYEIEFEVMDAFFHRGAQTLLHCGVSGVRRRKMRRAAPRMAVSEQATARVVFCRTLSRDTELEVRLADVSTTGVAFTATRALDPGDLLSVSTVIRGHAIDMEVRVIRSDPAPYGRFRIGCEITELEDDARAVIDQIATAEPAGSESERQPDRLEARERMRDSSYGLSERLHPEE